MQFNPYQLIPLGGGGDVFANRVHTVIVPPFIQGVFIKGGFSVSMCMARVKLPGIVSALQSLHTCWQCVE